MTKITPDLGFKEIHDDYDFFRDVRDSLGRSWRLAAIPKRGGSHAYFRTITDMRFWVRQVEEVRQMARGEKTTFEKLMDILHTSCYPSEVNTLQRLSEKMTKTS